MRNLGIRFAIAAGVALVVAGCGGSTPQINSAPTTAHGALGAPTSGGTFTASYDGTWIGKCHYFHGNHGGSHCRYALSGTGSGSFIGDSAISAHVTCDASDGFFDSKGKAVIRSSGHHNNQLALNVPLDSEPCGQDHNYALAGGKGKFKNASGSGTASILGLVGTGSGSFSASFQGTLYY